jgi:chromosome segregation ATPase
MDSADGLTVETLKQTRDEVKQTRLDLSERIDARNARLRALEGDGDDMASLVRGMEALARCEPERARELEELNQRITRLEAHTGLKRG